MNTQNSYFTVWVPLAIVLLLAFGWSTQTVSGKTDGKPSPVPPPTISSCAQNAMERSRTARFFSSRDQQHHAQILQQPSATGLALLNDEVITTDRFDDIGPIVYRPDGKRFAFIGVRKNVTYFLEYGAGEFSPRIAERMDPGSRDQWVCYSPSGEYLVLLASQNRAWFLFTYDAATHGKYQTIALAGAPSNVEMQARNAQNEESIRYRVELDSMTQEIRTLLQ